MSIRPGTAVASAGETRLGALWIIAIISVSALAYLPGLASAGRLTYHEAIWAQAAREMLARGDWVVPTLDGRPWLEKPPVNVWLIAVVSQVLGRVDELSARLPSAVIAAVLAVGVATLAARGFGRHIGGLAGLIQATSAWAVLRGRLAEADVILACLITWAFVAFNALRHEGSAGYSWRWAFFALLGATALAKGIGFGAVLVLAVITAVLLWDRDRGTLHVLTFLPGWILAAMVGLVWPLAVSVRHPGAWRLWLLHVSDRLAGQSHHFAGESWWEYLSSPLWQVLPWTPFMLAGAWRSWQRTQYERWGPDRLLWACAIVPAVLVSLANVRNAHYLIHAFPPLSVWGALGLVRFSERLGVRYGQLPVRASVGQGTVVAAVTSRGCASPGVTELLSFGGLALVYGLGFLLLGPGFDRRGAEWSFYATAGRQVPPNEPLVLLYDDWDRKPYPSPFGPMPHDLAIRLFYLNRPASWCDRDEGLASRLARFSSVAVIARERDLPLLRRLGAVEVLAQGPMGRFDRAFWLFQVTSFPRQTASRVEHRSGR